MHSLLEAKNGKTSCRSKSRERKLRSMDSVDVLDSTDLDSSVQASLLEAELQGTGATRSAVELSLDEDKVCSMLHLCHMRFCNLCQIAP